MCFKVQAGMRLEAKMNWVATGLKAEMCQTRTSWVREGLCRPCTNKTCRYSKHSPTSLSTRLRPWSKARVHSAHSTTPPEQTQPTSHSPSRICLWAAAVRRQLQARIFQRNRVLPQTQIKISIIINRRSKVIKILRFDPRIRN